MIVRNEAEVLEETVQSALQDFDELVIVDTGSEDSTVDVAKSVDAHLGYFEWCDDFSAARNYAASKARTEWILVLDADDYIPEEHRGKFKEAALQAGDDVAAIRVTITDRGRRWNQHRLYRPVMAHYEGACHNQLAITAGTQIRREDLAVEHDRTRRSEERRAERSAQRSEMNEAILRKENTPRGRFYLAMTVMDAGRTEEAVGLWLSYLEIGAWTEERYEARCRLATCKQRLGDIPGAVEQLALACTEEGRRAEAAHRLGQMYEGGRAFERARFWYAAAAAVPAPDTTGCSLFVDPSCYGVDTLKRLAAEQQVNSPEWFDAHYRNGLEITERKRLLLQHIADMVNAEAPVRVVDVGTGRGELLAMLDAPEVVGVDFSEEAARENPAIVVDDATVLSTQEDESADAVVSVSLLEHLEEASQNAVVEQMDRIAAPGAMVVVAMPVPGAMEEPAHQRELAQAELEEMLGGFFANVQSHVYDAWICASANKTLSYQEAG